MEQAQKETPAAVKGRASRLVKVGKVISDKMDKTVIVSVNKTVMQRLYRRMLTRSSKFMAHDEGNECRVGDVVELVSMRPLSKGKRWRVQRILKRAEGG